MWRNIARQTQAHGSALITVSGGIVVFPAFRRVHCLGSETAWQRQRYTSQPGHLRLARQVTRGGLAIPTSYSLPPTVPASVDSSEGW